MSRIEPSGSHSILSAFEVLNAGGLVAFPTETVYGLGAVSYIDSAVNALYNIKGRPKNKPLICHYGAVHDVWRDAEPNEVAVELARKFWPGPITLVLKRKLCSKVSEIACAGLDTISVRVPANDIARDLLEKVGIPLVATSANKSMNVTCTTAEMVLQDFNEEDILIIDGGKTCLGIESTVIDVVDPSNIKILRLGSISAEEMRSVVHIKNIHIADNKLSNTYHPKTHELVINSIDCTLEDAFLDFGTKKDVACKHYRNLSVSGDLNEAATNFFYMLGELDKTDCKNIVVAPIPNTGIGKTINDRLLRASKTH